VRGQTDSEFTSTLLQIASFLLRSEHGLMGLGVIGLVLAGFVAWGFRQFRFGGVVEEGTGLAAGLEQESITSSLKQPKSPPRGQSAFELRRELVNASPRSPGSLCPPHGTRI